MANVPNYYKLPVLKARTIDYGGFLRYTQGPALVKRLCPNKPTLQFHADADAFLEAAVRTAFALRLVDKAVAVVDARVDLLVLHRALEEPCEQMKSNI